MIQGLASQARQLLARAKRERALASAYQQFWRDGEGRMVLEDIFRASGLLEVSHVQGDPGTSQFNDGRRSIALHIIQRLRWSEGELVALANAQTREDLEELTES